MEPSLERQQELEPLAIHVYQQISAGYPMDQIRSHLKGVDLSSNDTAWVLENGKQRYLGYQKFLLESNRNDAKWFILGGIAFLVVCYLFVSIMGWSTAPRLNGKIYFGYMVGIGSVIYGAYCWLTAAPDGVREDLD